MNVRKWLKEIEEFEGVREVEKRGGLQNPKVQNLINQDPQPQDPLHYKIPHSHKIPPGQGNKELE